MRVIAYTLFGSLSKEEVNQLREAMKLYNASRVWNGCYGVRLASTIYDDPDLAEAPVENFLWPIIATDSISYKVLVDEAAIVRFWLAYTAKNAHLRLKVKLRDHHSGVLYGIPRVIMEGQMEVDISEAEIDRLLLRYPEEHRNMLREVFVNSYKKATEGEWMDIRDAVHKISFRTDGRLVYHLESRFGGNLQQAIADAVRGLIALLRVDSVDIDDDMFQKRDFTVDLTLPEDLWRAVSETAAASRVSPEDFLNLAMIRTVTCSW